jgi:hypothetical protein
VPAIACRPDSGPSSAALLGLRQRGIADRISISRRSVFSWSSRSASAAASWRIVGGQKPRAKIGRADPAAGIDARAKKKAQVIGGGCLVHPRHVRQRAQPGRSRRASTFSPCRTKARLTPVRGATSATVASATRSRSAIRSGPFTPSFAHEPVRLDQHQKHHRGRAEMRKVPAFVLPVGVHHGKRRGQGLAAKVVVQDHHIRAALPPRSAHG